MTGRVMRFHLVSFIFLAIVLFDLSFALVVTEPCCHVFEHRGAMFGPELPVKRDAMFGFLPERPRISSVEGVLKPTDPANPMLCGQHNVARQTYHFENSIAFIPRGGCSFAEKVYFAQLLQAKAAIIYQAKPSSDSSSGLLPGTGNDDVIVMAEDSRYAQLVDIPSAFISYNSWMHIYTLLKQNSPLASADEYYDLDLDGLPSLRALLKRSDEVNNTKTQSKSSSVVLDYEATYKQRLASTETLVSESGLDHELVSDIHRVLTEHRVYVVLNETGSLAIAGPDALPMMWDSMMFLVKVFLIIWSVVGFAYVSNWIKMKINMWRRQHIIRTLPCKRYSTLQFHSRSKSMKMDLESNSSAEQVESERLLQEYDPLARQGSDLKLRSSPKKASKSSSDSTDSPTSSVALIDCDNCVICLSEFELEDYVSVLPCKHIYHKECIEPWLVNKSSLCPICKQSIFKNGESRSINELNENDAQVSSEIANYGDGSNRGGSSAITIGMFIVIVLGFTFLMVDDNE